MDARAIEDLIYRQSGLLGVSGISSDMRTLRASPEPAARRSDRLSSSIASSARSVRWWRPSAALDALVFTAGIGENDAATRQEVAAGCGWLGVTLDAARNAAGGGRISAEASRVAVWVMPTDEERMIARHTVATLARRA